jgi:alkanesulfonate monooxygenase SsuD/methylene tetrahydromethanopterin reductase-like flavin-dependent oxidoreductase (luciferase family)
MRIALMIEPQQDVTWDLHVSIVQRAEAAGFGTLYRSDHCESFPGPAGKRTTDAWATIAGLVRETTTLRHGTTVSPITYRNLGNIAKAVATIDEMSGGRVELGLGAGWHKDEQLPPWPGLPGLPEAPAVDRSFHDAPIVTDRRTWPSCRIAIRA